MIIGIDASRSLNAHPTGVERYSTEIIRALLNETRLQGESFRLYTPRALSNFSEKDQRIIPFWRGWTLIRLSLEMLLHKPDLLFVPAYGLPLFAPKRCFVTVHDVAFEKFPEVYRPFQRWMLKWTTRRALRRAEVVFVPSQAVADDVQKFYSKIKARVHVVPHGPLHLQSGASSHSVKGDYLLFIGRLEHKKNVLKLIDAWRLVKEEFPDLKLVLAGRASADWSKQDDVLELGFCDEATIHSLLCHARALVLPSLDEGFGFPLLQAFEASCPVVCSRIPALVEVGAGAVLTFDPNSVASMRDALLKLLKEDELRAVLAVRGQERLKHFSWSIAAKTMAEVFKPFADSK